MIIDAHAHGYHGKTLDKVVDAGGEWARKVVANERKRAQDRPDYLDPTLSVKRLNRLEYDLQVVTPLIFIDVNQYPGDVKTKVAIARAINDNMARLMEEGKGKLLAVGTVPPDSMEQGGRQEMERAINGLGLKGMNLPTNVVGKPLDSPEFEPFWAQANAMDIPVWTHPLYPPGEPNRKYEMDYWLHTTLGYPYETSLMLCRLVFSGVMERYPNLKVISHHLGGGMVPFFWGRIDEVYADRKGTIDGLANSKDVIKTLPQPLFDYFARFYYDTAILGGYAIKCAYEVFGPDHIVYATDAPFGPDRGEARLAGYPKQIRELGYPADVTEKIFSGNIRKVLKI